MFNFISTLGVRDFRDDMKKALSLVTGNEVLRLKHRGDNPMRVVLTEEYFFELVAKAGAFSHQQGQPDVAESEPVDLNNPHGETEQRVKAEVEKILAIKNDNLD